MPPPATAAFLPAYEPTLRAIVMRGRPALAKPALHQAERPAASRRSVQGKDFLQRLREAGL